MRSPLELELGFEIADEMLGRGGDERGQSACHVLLALLVLAAVQLSGLGLFALGGAGGGVDLEHVAGVRPTKGTTTTSTGSTAGGGGGGGGEAQAGAFFGGAVLMVVDGLRSDMPFGAGLRGGALAAAHHMPFTRKLARSEGATAYVAHASTPTVTMPRIKALTTGKVGRFVDLLQNFDSPEITSDSIIARLKARGMRMVLYGDDTWLKLFPTAFMRSDGALGRRVLQWQRWWLCGL
jgi:hypothetical protein